MMIGNRPLLERVVDRLSLLSGEILVVIAQGQPKPALSRTKVVVDLYPGKGVLGGIYTGLVAAQSFHVLVVAADMPFLSSSLLHYLTQVSPAYDVIIPRIGDELEPLHAIYSKNCLAPIQQQIEQGKLKVRDFLDQVRVRYVEEAEISRFDPKKLSFFNINTSADLGKARALLKESENLAI